MSSGFDDFLNDLRGELERCVAAEEAATARQAPARVPPWRSRTVLVWATALLVVAAVAVGAVETQSANRPPATNGLLPIPDASGSAAFVLPPTPVPVTSPTSSAQPALAGYSLTAVAAHTATDAWAVGNRIDTTDRAQGGALHSLIMHWDGTVWREVPTPDIGPLTAVAVAGDGQAWAIDPYAGEALHWDGSVWAAIANDLPAYGELTAITVTAANDVWAVGRAPDGSAGPLVLHWNGLTWRAADTSPAAAGPGVVLRSVSGSSPTDVWAVGSTADGHDLVLHWNGSVWASVTATPSGSDDASSGPSAVTATAANDVWISTGQSVQHWDGAHWRTVPTPFATPSAATMSAVASSDVWLCARGLDGLANWDGSTWRRFGADEMGLTAQDTILGVAARATEDVWAVGTVTAGDGSPVVPLVLHWNGESWRIVVHAVKAL
jgi:hypothetical protein